ncbi:spore coat protein [Bacillus sp. T33-2]|uniref:spore coat protein n=1 Tax=Bacillus sp. T33-2 TaxID=2054168 RepID=UPI0015E10813|nr:spore coat protein [Bacillus sp. T33-2]
MDDRTLGAHEVLELHEVIEYSINALHQFHLYQPHVQEEELWNSLNRQIEFMVKEYDFLISLADAPSANKNDTVYDFSLEADPIYGMDNPQQTFPKASSGRITDRDIASGMLNCHKAGASLKLRASLECANPTLRSALLQGVKNSADMAYEVFQYMNMRGYYQVPILNNQRYVLNQYGFSPENLGFESRI